MKLATVTIAGSSTGGAAALPELVTYSVVIDDGERPPYMWPHQISPANKDRAPEPGMEIVPLKPGDTFIAVIKDGRLVFRGDEKPAVVRCEDISA